MDAAPGPWQRAGVVRSWSVAVLVLCALMAFAERASCNLLAGREPARLHDVRNARVLTDGVRAPDGDDWDTQVTAKFGSEAAFVEYDLDRVVPVVAAYLQGDNNDEYVLSISTDGNDFRELWIAGRVNSFGVRQRSSDSLRAEGRYVRVAVRGGDRSYSLSELQLFSETPDIFPPELEVRSGLRNAPRARTALLSFGLAFAVFLFAAYRRAPIWWLFAAALPPVVASYYLFDALRLAWPLEAREVSMLRAVAAAIALLLTVRLCVFNGRFAAHPVATFGAFAVSAALACASYFNLGRPQFWNHLEDRQEFVHTWDMRIYYPFARYFEELRYDGVYLASALTYLEEVGATVESIGQVPIRNLRTHRLSRVEDVTADMQAVRERFTPERWEAFGRDMTYFRDTMGDDYLKTMNDHGANGTPVWVLLARLAFAGRPASEAALTLGALLDPVLLAALFLTAWRTFGLYAALAAMVVFGANDFYMFGTNWAGSTLRCDWLVCLGFGACALRRERYVLAGLLFGLSGAIRLFPVVVLAGVALPALWWFGETWVRDKRPPSLNALYEQHRGAVRVIAVAVGFMLLALVVTGLLFSFGVWVEWWQKVSLLNREPTVNEVSLRALIAGTDGLALRMLRARLPLYVAAIALCVAAVALACRRRPLDQAALLALPLIPVLSNSVNYHIHFIFLLPLLAAAAVDLLGVAGPLLAVCVAQYWPALDPDPERRFQAHTALLFVGLAWLFYNVLRRSEPWRELAELRASPKITSEPRASERPP